MASSTLERELKLGAPDGFVLPELPGEPLDSRVFTSTYYDTDDRRLLRSGVTLRRRLENGKNAWQLKIPRGGDRVEVEAEGAPAGPPAELKELLAAVLRGRKLVKVATLRTRRRGLRVRDDERELADVVVDSVSVLDGGKETSTFSEIEIELLDGDETALERIESALRDAGAGPHDGSPKIMRTVRLDESAAPPSSAPLSEQVRARIGAQLDALVAHDPGARLGGDPEDVHDLRVAVRRLRALLRAARDVVDPVFAEPLRAELQWLGDSLGPARDLDVLLAYLRSDAARFDDDDRTAFDPLLATLEGTREQAQPALLETLRSERYLALLDELERAAASLPLIPGAAVSPQDLAGAEFRKLRKAVRALDGHPEPEAVHAVRIKGKRARYAAELASGKRAKRVVGAAKGFQDVVGEYQDAVVAEKRLRELVRGRSGRAALAIGRLVERQRRRREAALSALPRAWRKLERAGRRAWT